MFCSATLDVLNVVEIAEFLAHRQTLMAPRSMG